MLTKPRTVCFCHWVASIISPSVAPFARFIIAITSAFLLQLSGFGLSVGFWGTVAFLALLAAALACLRPLLGFSASGVGSLLSTLDARGCIAFQIRATADFRSVKLLHGRLTWDAVPDLDESAQGPIGGNLGEGL